MILKRYLTLFFTAAAVICILCGCSGEQSGDNGKVKVACGLPPVAFIAHEVGGKNVAVQSMLPVGRSPHDYAPRPADIRDAGRAALFFTTGMNFEQSASRAMPESVKIIDVTSGIRRRHFDDGQGCCDGHGEAHDHNSEALDPHIWLSPVMAAHIADTVRDALVAVDPDHAAEYQKNCSTLKKRLMDIHAENLRRLAPFAGREFLVYHPAFGYFAHAYNLKQRAIELNGREASPAQLAQITKEAKEGNIHTIFIQEQFNPGSAKALARQIGGIVAPMDPLAADICENFRKMAQQSRVHL